MSLNPNADSQFYSTINLQDVLIEDLKKEVARREAAAAARDAAKAVEQQKLEETADAVLLAPKENDNLADAQPENNNTPDFQEKMQGYADYLSDSIKNLTKQSEQTKQTGGKRHKKRRTKRNTKRKTKRKVKHNKKRNSKTMKKRKKN